jgi:hypothetical protein
VASGPATYANTAIGDARTAARNDGLADGWSVAASGDDEPTVLAEASGEHPERRLELKYEP